MQRRGSSSLTGSPTIPTRFVEESGDPSSHAPLHQMIILGKHKQSFDLIRSLAITCHALDLSGDHLFLTGTYNRKPSRTKEICDELLSTSLLNLAVALRTNIYQGSLTVDTRDYFTHCGFLDVGGEGNMTPVRFSLKDVCDKIIHADTIFRELLDEPSGPSRSVTIIQGSYKGNKWEMSLSVELFCEAILNWLDGIGCTD